MNFMGSSLTFYCCKNKKSCAELVDDCSKPKSVLRMLRSVLITILETKIQRRRCAKPVWSFFLVFFLYMFFFFGLVVWFAYFGARWTWNGSPDTQTIYVEPSRCTAKAADDDGLSDEWTSECRWTKMVCGLRWCTVRRLLFIRCRWEVA